MNPLSFFSKEVNISSMVIFTRKVICIFHPVELSQKTEHARWTPYNVNALNVTVLLLFLNAGMRGCIYLYPTRSAVQNQASDPIYHKCL